MWSVAKLNNGEGYILVSFIGNPVTKRRPWYLGGKRVVVTFKTIEAAEAYVIKMTNDILTLTQKVGNK